MRHPLKILVERPPNAIQTHSYAVEVGARLEYAYILARAQMHMIQDRAIERADAGAVKKDINIENL